METSEQATSDSQNSAVGARKGNTNGVKSGIYSLMKLRRAGQLDGRTALGKKFLEREQEYIRALGGDVSPMLERIINDTVWCDLYLAVADNYLSQLKHLARKNKPHCLLETRLKIAAHRRENIKMLGLKRVPKPVPSILEMEWGDSPTSDELSQDGQASANGEAK